MNKLKIGMLTAVAALTFAGPAQEKAERSFTFASWNVGHYAMGETYMSTIPVAEAAAKSVKYREFKIYPRWDLSDHALVSAVLEL